MHGSITTLGRLNSGISINLAKLSGVAISSDGKTATILGGTNTKFVIDSLWAAGKQAVTGTCECISYMGPALGGGLAWLQGRHGLIADQFLSLTLVLADGTLKTIDKSSDLFWAMNGAGHNFGIVTAATIKIHPVTHPTWAIETLTFSGNKVAALYQAANEHLLKTEANAQPVDLINWSTWTLPPNSSNTTDGPIIEFALIQEGTTSVSPSYTAPFRALDPLSITRQTGPYPNVSSWLGISPSDYPCQKLGQANPRFPQYLKMYNPAAMAEVYEIFKAATFDDPASPFAGSIFLVEGYSMQGVRAVPAGDTAYAWRGENLVAWPLMEYDPTGPERDEEARRLGERMRRVLVEGSGRSGVRAYVNYAYGDEGEGAWYGYYDGEEGKGRRERLRGLKRRWDPRGRFSFYAPIDTVWLADGGAGGLKGEKGVA